MFVTVYKTNNLCVPSSICIEIRREMSSLNECWSSAHLTTMSVHHVCTTRKFILTQCKMQQMKRGGSWYKNVISLMTFLTRSRNSALSVLDSNLPRDSDVQLARRASVSKRINTFDISQLGTDDSISENGTQLQECLHTHHCACFMPLAYEFSELQHFFSGAMVFALMFRHSRKKTNVRWTFAPNLSVRRHQFECHV